MHRAHRLEGRGSAAHDRLGRDTEVLQAERHLAVDEGHDDLVLRILEERRDRARELGRSCVARVEPVHDHGPGESSPVEPGHEPGERAQQRRLAGAGGPEQRDDLSRRELQRDPVERRATCTRIGEADVVGAG
jgi:hypothetical protein